ncbi:MAG TPA: hypothetical protein VGN57_05040 [Pirellulaceae bacterium]|jgi:hypothetical protein|nr:hypothetical protein [Pirellulaceae bacterium]
MIDCRNAARLTSESQDRPLTWGERFQLAFHLGLCGMCRCYTWQLNQIRTLLRLSRERASDAPLPAVELSTDAKARIAAAMDREANA